jgi:hypothetical protein
MRLAIAVALVLAAATTAARAETAERAFCPARPGKLTPTCTVDPGRVQLEVDLYDESFDRAGGVRATDMILAAPQLRIGLAPDSELQLAWTPYERQTARGGGTGEVVDGVGDAVVGAKLNLTHNGDGFGAALQPFVKLSTASHGLGDGKVEGGLVVPLSLPLAGGWSLGVSPELDAAADDAGGGYHAAAAVAAGLSHALGKALSFGAELWAAEDLVARSRTQATVDLMLAWTPAFLHDVQFDVGGNFGLTRAAPDAEVYLGLAKRF